MNDTCHICVQTKLMMILANDLNYHNGLYFQDNNTAEDIRDFLWRTRTPLVGQLKWRTKKYYDEERPLVIAFYDVDWGLDIVRS